MTTFRDMAARYAAVQPHGDDDAIVWALLAIEDRLDVIAHALAGGSIDPRRSPVSPQGPGTPDVA